MSLELIGLPRDVLINLALELAYPDILNLCKSAERFDRDLCQNNAFWKLKIQKEFNITSEQLAVTRYKAEIIYKNLLRLKDIYPELLDIVSLFDLNKFVPNMARYTRIKFETDYSDFIFLTLQDKVKSKIVSDIKGIKEADIKPDDLRINELIFTSFRRDISYYQVIEELEKYISDPTYKFRKI